MYFQLILKKCLSIHVLSVVMIMPKPKQASKLNETNWKSLPEVPAKLVSTPMIGATSRAKPEANSAINAAQTPNQGPTTKMRLKKPSIIEIMIALIPVSGLAGR
ncbi:hypothetical protein D3C86_1692830 [compost metagenome]